MTQEGELLWTPDEARRAASRLRHFMTWASAREARQLDDYDAVLAWSIDDLEGFWSAFADWYGVRWHATAPRALADPAMPGASWFPGARLNYAEHLLYPPAGADKDAVAVYFAREDGLRQQLTWRELRAQVASVRAWLAAHG